MKTQLKEMEIDWEKCRQQLFERIRPKVYEINLPRWKGEETDIAHDAVQDTMRKLLEELRKIDEGEKKPIENLESWLFRTCLNCLLDRRRREMRLCPENAQDPYIFADSRLHPSDIAVQNVYEEGLFLLAAERIAEFPAKQRAALLTDLASLMAFDEKPTPLQAAFRAQSIQMEEYRHRQPNDKKERSCHAALLYQVYMRVKGLKDNDADLQTYLEKENEQELCLA
ncbi:MAG TPA: hypothetical protein VF458_17325 [Ktedonobacteraceae bacterium]